MEVTLQRIRSNSEQEATHFSCRQMSWSSTKPLIYSLQNPLSYSEHTMLLIPYTVTTLEGKVIPHWFDRRYPTFSQTGVPRQAVGIPSVKVGWTGQSSNALLENTWTHSYLYQLWLKPIYFPDMKALVLYHSCLITNLYKVSKTRSLLTSNDLITLLKV